MGYKISALLLVVIMALTGVGYWYYTTSQATIQVLTANNAKLDTAIQLNEETITSLQEDYTKVVEQNNKIQAEYADIRQQNNRLRDKLSDLDLGLIASEKPDSIERAINRGTINAGRCFEILSGARLTEKETNAENGEQFNKECPWLWPGNTTSELQ
jgi:FtsZ-binding cell division protein ZapB|tara:strand:- start:6576 stop:7046 length:471 start_codon:yes stop_codon:yes gene_type:complete